MNPEAQRIAIAEACGWRYVDPNDWKTEMEKLGYSENNPPYTNAGIKAQIYSFPHDLPDYLSDLNAMHEAEKILSEDRQRHYAHYELRLNIGIMGLSSPEDFRLVHATAAQRTEAFLKTIGKWEEE